MKKILISRTLLLAAASITASLATAEVDWASAASRDITFFNAGTASWEGILIKDSHDGAKGVRKRKACVSCHLGEEAEIAESVSGDSSHQFYASASPASLNGTLQMSIDGDVVHFRVALPGVDSGQVSMMLDDGAFESSALSGCWASCHADAKGMPHDSGAGLTKYLSRSRSKNSKTGGGENYKPADQLAQLLGNGEFLELMAVRFSADSVQGSRGYVLEKRYQEEGAALPASFADGVVSFSRPLAAGGQGQKTMAAGGSYTLGLSLHQGDSNGSKHLVSFPVNFTLGEGGEIQLIEEAKDED